MACSAVTLSFATITAVVAVACLAIAFGTDNWYEIRVNRTYIEEREPIQSQKEFDEDVRFFSRDVGLFRMCFPDAEKPKKAALYMSPVQTECLNLDYYIPQNQENENTKRFSDQRWERIHMARSVIGMYIVGFFFIFISFFTGVAGCWKRSKGNILATGLLQMLA
ncbi:claudin domain-containing protein 1, partial [Trichonephila clavata]